MGSEFHPSFERVYWTPGRRRFRYALDVGDWAYLSALIAPNFMTAVILIRPIRRGRPPIVLSRLQPIGPAA